MITYTINDLVYNHNMYKINNIPLPSYLYLATTTAATAHGKCSILVALGDV